MSVRLFRKSLLTGIVVLLLLHSSVAFAETSNTPAQSDSTLMDTVVVTATRVETDLLSIPVSVSVVGKKEIEDNPSPVVADQFVHTPGVSFSAGKTGAGNNSMISIRGLEAGRVLYMIDGVRQNSIFKEDMNKGLMNIAPDDIERIEVIKGPASALYGSDALGGVVNIITKKGGKGKPIGAKISMMGDSSVTGIEPRLAVYGDLNGFSYRLSGSFMNANDRQLAQGGTADHSAYTSQSLSGQFGYAWDKGSLNFTAQHYDSDVKEMSAIYSWTDKKMVLYDKHDPAVYYLSDFPRNRRDMYTGELVLDDLTENLVKFRATSHYQFRDTIQRGEEANGTIGVSNRLQDISDSYGSSIQTDWRFFDSHSLTVGAEYLYDSLKNNSITATDAPEYSFDAMQRTIAVFAQDAWKFADQWTLNIGLRQSWISTELKRFESDPNLEDSSSESSLVGNIGLVFAPIDTLAFRVQYSQGFRTPDLASQFTGTGIYLVPNTALKPEKSQNYELGVRFNNDTFFVDSSVFYNKIDNFMTTRVIGYIPNTTWSVNETVNAATYTSYGWELDASWRIADTGFSPYGNVTVMKTELEHEKYTTRHNRTPEAWGTLGLKWERQMDEKSRLFTDISYRMSSPYKFDGGDNSIWYEHKGGKTLNASIGLELGEEKQFKAILSVKNILNKEYEPDYYYYSGIHGVLSLSYEF